MNRQLHTKRLTIALKELWISNRTILYSFPLITLLCFAIFYLWPGSIFYEKLLDGEAFSSTEDWLKALLQTYPTQRIFILIVIPIYLIICTKPTLDKLNTSERTNLIPITRLERTLALTLFAIGVTCLGFASFMLYDHIIANWFKNMYYEEALQYLEAQGNLYPVINPNTAFYPISTSILGVIFMMIILLLPLYFLSLVFFRKHSFISFLALLVIIIIALIFLLRWLFVSQTSSVSIPVKEVLPLTLHILIVISYWCLAMATFYHKLKEKEI